MREEEDAYATVKDAESSGGTYNLIGDLVSSPPRYEQQPPTFIRRNVTAGSAESPYAYVAGSHKNAPTLVTDADASSAAELQPISSSLLEPELESFLTKLKLFDKCAQLSDDAGIVSSSDFTLFSTNELVKTFNFKVGHVRKIFKALEHFQPAAEK